MQIIYEYEPDIDKQVDVIWYLIEKYTLPDIIKTSQILTSKEHAIETDCTLYQGIRIKPS